MERETGYEVEGTPGGQPPPGPGATRAGHPGGREQMTAALRAQMDDGTLKPATWCPLLTWPNGLPAAPYARSQLSPAVSAPEPGRRPSAARQGPAGRHGGDRVSAASAGHMTGEHVPAHCHIFPVPVEPRARGRSYLAPCACLTRPASRQAWLRTPPARQPGADLAAGCDPGNGQRVPALPAAQTEPPQNRTHDIPARAFPH
jgi:hypothetical protein